MPDEDVELRMIDVRQCPMCFEWYEETGENSILPHILKEHPTSIIAEMIQEGLT